MRLRKEQAVIGQPIYLIIALIVASTILAIFALSLIQTSTESQIQQVYHELNKIITEAVNMFEYADEGSVATIHVEFPQTMQCLIFGSLPRNNSIIPFNLTLQENTSNNYYVVMRDGFVSTSHANARFSGENETTIAVLLPGSYEITLELTQNEGKTYVKIYEQH